MLMSYHRRRAMNNRLKPTPVNIAYAYWNLRPVSNTLTENYSQSRIFLLKPTTNLTYAYWNLRSILITHTETNGQSRIRLLKSTTNLTNDHEHKLDVWHSQWVPILRQIRDINNAIYVSGQINHFPVLLLSYIKRGFFLQ